MNNHQLLEVRNPFSGELLDTIKKPTPLEVQDAFAKAEKAYQDYMKKMPAWERAEILFKVAELIASDSEELSFLIAKEGGKPLKDARVEVARAVNTVKMSGMEALRLNGEQITMDRAKGSENHISFTLKQPIGVVLAISAFNHPVNLICHQVSTAIASGNAVVLKPAEKTPLSAKKITDFFYQAGLNPDALQYLVLSGKETEEILTNPVIKYVSFIGNADIGWLIRRKVLPGVKVMLEHGGTAATIVANDANLNIAVPSIIRGAYYHSGQVCVSTQLVYVHEKIYDAFVNQIKESVNNLKTGDATLPDTDCGPLITKAVVEKMKFLIEDAKIKGAKVLIGGNPLPNQCFAPTLLENVNSEMLVFKDEVFGPLLSIIKYKEIDEVINVINKSKFAFQTSIYTENIDLAFYYAKNIEQKACIINDSTAFRVDWMPFGGYKESGFGTGGIKYAINDMMEDKLIVLKNNYGIYL
jgi:acyl-CoA reductase-like NAD-dependent aldehyde dehydrogenase